jgi:hypothetical protein
MADRFDRYTRRIVLAMIPIALIAVVDLPTGWLLDDRRLDIALVAALGMGLWGVYSLRRFATRLRADDLPARPTRRRWVGSFASLAASLALSAGLGYLIGGWLPAVLLPSATLILMAGSVAVGLRRRRRIEAGP